MKIWDMKKEKIKSSRWGANRKFGSDFKSPSELSIAPESTIATSTSHCLCSVKFITIPMCMSVCAHVCECVHMPAQAWRLKSIMARARGWEGHEKHKKKSCNQDKIDIHISLPSSCCQLNRKTQKMPSGAWFPRGISIRAGKRAPWGECALNRDSDQGRNKIRLWRLQSVWNAHFGSSKIVGFQAFESSSVKQAFPKAEQQVK